HVLRRGVPLTSPVKAGSPAMVGCVSSTDEFDDLTADDLREQGSLKWTKYGGDTIGAFVAEMDFGVAPPIAKALHAAVKRATFGYLPPALRAGLTAACAQWYER